MGMQKETSRYLIYAGQPTLPRIFLNRLRPDLHSPPHFVIPRLLQNILCNLYCLSL